MVVFVAIVAGFCTGILSSWGIGGGTLLVLYMTAFAGIPQTYAQGINLLYFLPVTAGALRRYLKAELIDVNTWKLSALFGCLTAGASAYFAQFVEAALLRTLFGWLLLYMGVRELWQSFRQTAHHVRGQ